MNIFLHIYLASFLVACVNYMITVSLAMFLADVHQSGPLIVGLAGFIGCLSFTLSTFLLSRRPAVKNRSLFFIYVPIYIGILSLLISVASIPAIFAITLTTGILYAFFWPSVQSCFSRAENESKLGRFNLAWSAGVICGAMLAGILYELRPHAPFIFALIFTIGSLLLLTSKKSHFPALKNHSEKRIAHQKFPTETVKEIRLLSFLHFTAASSVLFLYPKLGLERAFSPRFIGLLFGLLLTCRLITFFLLRNKPLILHPYRFVISCLFFMVSSCLVGLGTSQYTVLAGMLLLGVVGAFSYHNSLLAHVKYGLPTEIHESIIGAGSLTGAIIAGVIGEVLNIPSAFVIIGVAIFLSGLWHSRKLLTERHAGQTDNRRPQKSEAETAPNAL